MEKNKQAPPPEPSRLVSLEEAARLLAVSSRHVRTLAQRGHLKIVALGRRRLVPRAEVDRIVAEALS